MEPPLTQRPEGARESEEALTPYAKKWIRRTLYLSFLNFIIAGTLALFMREDQAGNSSAIGALGTPQVFGQLLTAHGLGMFIGWQFPFTYALVSYIFPKYMGRKIYNEKLLEGVFWTFLVGFYIVWAAITLGFGAGWYFLFPLPFHAGPPGVAPWGPVQAFIFFTGMILTTLSLFLFSYNVFGTAFSRKYRDSHETKPGMINSFSAKLAAAIGLDAYLPSAVTKRIEEYPVASISAVVTVITMIVGGVPFFVLLIDGFWVSLSQPGFLNGLVAQNFLWIDYHPIVYFAFFPLIGMYYTLIPIFSKKGLPGRRWPRAPWPILMLTAVGVYSHHLFQVTVQPLALNLLGEGMSMAVGFASGLSVFTLFVLIWRTKYEWTLTAKFLSASIVGWIIGGVMGVEESNIPENLYLHNTYAVVAHFHFNALDGVILAAFGVFYWILPEIAHKQWYSMRLGEIHFWGTIVGGFGLAGVFAGLGYLGVPRREYLPFNPILPFTITLNYQFYLNLALAFAFIVALAQIPFIWNLVRTMLGPKVPVNATLPSFESTTLTPETGGISRVDSHGGSTGQADNPRME